MVRKFPNGTMKANKEWWLRGVVFAACLAPLAGLIWQGTVGGLGANPIEAVVRSLGDWSLRLLLATLSITPLRQLSGWNMLARYRRMIGLFAFTYGVLHVFAYISLDQTFDWPVIAAEIAKRRYIWFGLAGFLILLALAVTSTDGMIRRLGGRRWRLLHRLVYLAGALGVIHHFMMVKADIRPPLVHGVVLAVLLGWRVMIWLRSRKHS
jgi:sulfoxide reductase heme-binding subunit YedZ